MDTCGDTWFNSGGRLPLIANRRYHPGDLGRYLVEGAHQFGDRGDHHACQLRQRLELTALAIDTGAPLSTAEVSLLLGARPGHERVERGGLVARRISRNVWRLSRLDQEDRQSSYRTDGFRRRL